MRKQTEKLVVGINEAAKMLDVSHDTVSRMIKAGEISTVQVHNQTKIPVHVIHALVGLKQETVLQQ